MLKRSEVNSIGGGESLLERVKRGMRGIIWLEYSMDMGSFLVDSLLKWKEE